MAYTVRLLIALGLTPLRDLILSLDCVPAGPSRLLWQSPSFVLENTTVDRLSWQHYGYQVLVDNSFILSFLACDDGSWGQHALCLNRHRALIRTARGYVSPRGRRATPKSALAISETIILKA